MTCTKMDIECGTKVILHDSYLSKGVARGCAGSTRYKTSPDMQSSVEQRLAASSSDTAAW
jgi:hypothetical protein